MNLANALMELEKKLGEEIESFTIGPHDDTPWDAPKVEPVLVSRTEGLLKLNYEYNNGFGCPDCHPFYAWTPSWVFFIHEYDGATGIRKIPRNPQAIEPHFGGELR